MKQKERKDTWQEEKTCHDELENAFKCLKNVLKNSEEREDKRQVEKTYLGLGMAYRSNNNLLQTAIEYFEKVLEIAKEHEDKQQIKTAYLWLGDTYRLNNQLSKVIEYFEKALEIAKEEEDKSGETQAYLGLGNAYCSNNQFQTGIEYIEKGLEIAKIRKDKQQEIEAYLGLGAVYRQNNQFPTAINNYQKALEIANEIKDKRQFTQASPGPGAAYILNNQFQIAINNYEEDLDRRQLREAEDGFVAAEVESFNQFGPAVDNHEKALEIKLNIQLPDTALIAIECYAKAFNIASEQGNKLQKTEPKLRLGEAYINNQTDKDNTDALKLGKDLIHKLGEDVKMSTNTGKLIILF